MDDRSHTEALSGFLGSLRPSGDFLWSGQGPSGRYTSRWISLPLQKVSSLRAEGSHAGGGQKLSACHVIQEAVPKVYKAGFAKPASCHAPVWKWF